MADTDAIRAAFTAIQAEADRDGLRYAPLNGPSSGMTKAQLLQQGQDNLAFAADVQASLGVVYELAAQGLAALGDAPPAPPVPPPDPPPLVTPFVSPVPNGGILGSTKWLAGSLGVDVFLPRGTAVVAPCDCRIEEVIGGTGLQGGAEIILATPDRQHAWRYRHVKAAVQVGQSVSQGQTVGAIYDTSLDSLGAIPAWASQQAGRPFPDGWQHADISVDQGGDQFAPTGGGGGNVSAYQWLESLGYQGTVLARTPGPPDAGVGLEESMQMMMPAERRGTA